LKISKHEEQEREGERESEEPHRCRLRETFKRLLSAERGRGRKSVSETEVRERGETVLGRDGNTTCIHLQLAKSAPFKIRMGCQNGF